MTNSLFQRSVFLLAVIVASNSALTAEALKVMSFNIRYDARSDTGARDWKHRRDAVADQLSSASIIGIQEALSHQLNDLKERSPEFDWVGVGRNDGKKAGEFVPIFYRKDIWKLNTTGTFWFSSTPTLAGSKSWGNTLPRCCTWARLVDTNGAGLYVFNAHLDHASVNSRKLSIELLTKKIHQRKYIDEPVVLLGDFNTTHGSGALKPLKETKNIRELSLIDSYLATDPEQKNPATFNRWNAQHNGEAKIDYIFHSPQLKVQSYSIIKKIVNGTPISDHWPQLAQLQWQPLESLKSIHWQYFKETVIDKEFGGGQGIIIRWNETTIPLRIIGGSDLHAKQIDQNIIRLNKALAPANVVIKRVTEPAKKEIRVYIGTFNKLKNVCQEEELSPPDDYAGYASIRWVTKTKEITESTILIATDRSDASLLPHVFLEEITQSLGLPGDNSVFPESVTFSRGDDHGDAPTLGSMDIQAIRLLYQNLKAGDDSSIAKERFLKHWNWGQKK